MSSRTSGARRGRSRKVRNEGGGSGRLRPLNEPRPVRVCTDADGRPTHVALPDPRAPAQPLGRGGDPARNAHSTRRGFLPVEAVRESWRIDDEWWRRPISRLYHDVVLEGGRLVTLYRDRVDGGWYLQG